MSTFVVNVDGVGTFECQRRTMRVAVAIGVEYARLTEGLEDVPENLERMCNVLAYLKSMIVSGPAGFDVYETDPDDKGEIAKLTKVYDAISEGEARFRKGPGKDAKGKGAKPDQDGGVVVSPEVPASSD